MFAVLLLLSQGSDWSWPRLIPHREPGMAPWQGLGGGVELTRALGTSLGLALAVSLTATPGGLLISRATRRGRPQVHKRMIAYLAFVLSPAVMGVCLYDLFVRLGLAGSTVGVWLAQCLMATAFTAVFFSEFWSPRTDAREQLVAMLGGTTWHRWRHAIWPQACGLILLGALQAALLSWLDFALASFLGGGRVSSLTVVLFAYLREGSVGQAAFASLLLTLPTSLGLIVFAIISIFATKSPKNQWRL